MDNNIPVYSIAIPVHLLSDREVSATAKLLYGVIDSFQKKSGMCYASNDRLAEELGGCTARTASKCVSELRNAGYIVVDDQKGRKIYLATSVSDGQGGGRKLLPPTKKVSTPHEENFQGGGRNFPPSNNSNGISPPLNPPEGGDPPPKSRRSSREYKAQAEILPERFEKFWSFYRAHIPPDSNAGNRQKAIRAWDKLKPSDELATTMALALAKQVKSQSWVSGVGVPHASTWLNSHGWEDDWGPSAELAPDKNPVANDGEVTEWAY